MKKKIILLFIILTSMVFAACVVQNQENGNYRVIKVTDGDTVYLDFNNNNYPDKDERVRINGIDTFETKINDHIKGQMKFYRLNRQEALGLGYLASQFAHRELLNKTVSVEFSADDKYDKYDRALVSIYYDCKKDPTLRFGGIRTLNLVPKEDYCKSYEQEILSKGLAKIYTKSNKAEYLKSFYDEKQYEKQLKKARKLNLVFYDYVNKKYYDIYDKEMDGYFQNNLYVKKKTKKY